MRNNCIDSIRNIASLMVLMSHFSYYFLNDKIHYNFNSTFHFILYTLIIPFFGKTAVALFFAVSGYLAIASMEKDKTFKKFYLKKITRILIPYNICYFFISFLLISFSLFNKELMHTTPLSLLLFNSNELYDLFPTIIGLDGILTSHFNNIHLLFFIGEWFIGTVLLIYLLVPLFYKIVNINFKISLLALICIFVFSFISYTITKLFLLNPFWFFLNRLPEFFIGCCLYKYKAYLFNKKSICIASCILPLGLLIVTQRADKLPLSPTSWIITIPLVILAFNLLDSLNNRFNMARFNKLSVYSYSFMLIQHVVLNLFMQKVFVDRPLEQIGFILTLIMLGLITFYLAKINRQLSKPVEDFLIQKINRNF